MGPLAVEHPTSAIAARPQLHFIRPCITSLPRPGKGAFDRPEDEGTGIPLVHFRHVPRHDAAILRNHVPNINVPNIISDLAVITGDFDLLKVRHLVFLKRRFCKRLA